VRTDSAVHDGFLFSFLFGTTEYTPIDIFITTPTHGSGMDTTACPARVLSHKETSQAMLWWHWSILGLVLIGMEILTLGSLRNFYFLFFGVSALMVSALAWLSLTETAWLQWCFFVLFGVISFFALRSTLRRTGLSRGKNEVSVDSMVGEFATVLNNLDAQRIGTVELHGSTWTARNAGTVTIAKGSRAKVIRVEGVTLWVQAEPIAPESPSD
jgi:inner membrane protein